MKDKDMLKTTIEEFSRVQEWMEMVGEEAKVYKSMKNRYIDLKVLLTTSGVNLTEIDRIKE